jgi:MFS family permease
MPFAPELGKALELTGPVTSANAIMISYLGLFLGDLIAGLLSQRFQSRKKVVFLCLAGVFIFTFIYLFTHSISPLLFYIICLMLGICAGYWALFVSIGAEQFGTNLRATAATTIPNFVRGSVVPLTLSFKSLTPTLGLLHAALTVGLVSLGIAFIALYYLPETFGRNLEFNEHP